MAKKFSFYLFLFLLVLFVNIYAAVRLFYKVRRIEATSHILSEIEENSDSSDPHNQFEYSSAPFVAGSYETKVVAGDGRSKNLKHFFRKYNSVLYDYSDYIVTISDKYQFDYRLLPAIAMQESTLCKFIPENSHNCWGWGIYGSLVTRFDSYEDAIDTVSKGIRKDYIDKGLLTTSSIMEKYTPPSQGSWAKGVNTVLGWLE